jgi:hypothetical protein
LSTTIVPPVVPIETVSPEPVILTEQGQAWLRARMSDHIDELAAVATRLSEHVEAVAKAGDDADELPDPPHIAADRERYVELVQELGALTSALREAVSVADVQEDPSIVELGDEVEVELPDGTLRPAASSTRSRRRWRWSASRWPRRSRGPCSVAEPANAPP